MKRCLAALMFFALPLAARCDVVRSRPPRQRGLTACRPRPACSSTPWTGRRTPAPISTSSPAAAGCEEPRSRPIARAGAASTSCRSATTTTLRQHSRRRRPQHERRRRHPKIGDYYASCMDESAINAKGAAPLEPLLKKIAALTERHAIWRRSSPSCTPSASTPFFSFGAEADFKDAIGAKWRSPIRAASACPIATTTSATMRSRSSCASSTSSTSARCRAARRPPDRGRRRGATA